MWQSLGWTNECYRTVAASATGAVTDSHWPAPVAEAATVQLYSVRGYIEKVGLHNHRWEHQLFFPDGAIYWDYFFTNTDPRVQMEQDVGWSACAGIDPIAQYEKYPHPCCYARESML